MHYSIISQNLKLPSSFPVASCRSIGLSISIVLLFCATTSYSAAEFNLDVTPIVRLEEDVSAQRVTGTITRSEWKRVQDNGHSEVSSCWEAGLLTFRVSESSSSKGKCVKKGVFVPRDIYTEDDPKVVIDASCSATQKYPAAHVRICQTNKPGDLKFIFEGMSISGEGTTHIIKAEHFKLEGQQQTSLNTFLNDKEGKRSVYFFLGGTKKTLLSAQEMAGGNRITSDLGNHHGQSTLHKAGASGTIVNHTNAYDQSLMSAPVELLTLPEEPTTPPSFGQESMNVAHSVETFPFSATHGTDNGQELDPVWNNSRVMINSFPDFQSRESKARREATLAQASYVSKLHLLGGQCRQTAQQLALIQKYGSTELTFNELGESVSKVSQKLEDSLEQMTKDLDQATSELIKRATWDAPPVHLTRQRAYIDLQDMTEDIEPVFARLQRAMEYAAGSNYYGTDLATFSSRETVGTVVHVTLAENIGGIVFCHDDKRVMRRLFSTGLYTVSTTFDERQPRGPKDSITEVAVDTGEVRMLNSNINTEQLLHPDPEMLRINNVRINNAELLPCDQGANSGWDAFVEADQQLLTIVESHNSQQVDALKRYQQRRQLLQAKIAELQESKKLWIELTQQIVAERDRLQLQLHGKGSGSEMPSSSITTAKLDDHSAALQQAIAETPFTVIVKFDANLRDIHAVVSEAGLQRVSSQLESMLDALLGPGALASTKGAEFALQELTPIALIPMGTGYRGLAKLTYQLKRMNPLPLCGDREFLQRIGLINMNVTSEGYTTYSDYRTRQEWLLIGMGDRGYGSSLDDVNTYVDRWGGGWRLPEVEEIETLKSSELYQFMQRNILSEKRPFWTASVHNAKQLGFCFSTCRQRNQTYKERAIAFADGDNLALLLLRPMEVEKP